MPASDAKPPATILIVDDSPDTLRFLTEALEREDFTVLVALRSDRALATLQQIRPDLVLMDALLPDLDGFETCRRLKRMPNAATIPVIFMTGLTDTQNVVRGFEAGGADYVTKPVVPQELVARIRVQLAAARVVDSAHAAMDATGHALFAARPDGRLCWATPAAARLLDRLNLPPGTALPAACHQPLAGGETTELLTPSGETLEIRLIGALHPEELLLSVAPARSSTEEAQLRTRFPVTPREAEVLMWLTRGKSNRDIAEILGLSPRTVNKHLEQIYEKLGVENRSSAVSLALRTVG